MSERGSGGGAGLREAITLDVKGTYDGGLKRAIADVKKLEEAMDRIHRAALGSYTARPKEYFADKLKSQSGGQKTTAREALTSLFGFNASDVKRHWDDTLKEHREAIRKLEAMGSRISKKNERELERLRSGLPFGATNLSGERFRSEKGLVEFAAQMDAKVAADSRKNFKAFHAAARGEPRGRGGDAGPASATVPAASINATVSGQISLVIPAAQITAVVEGQVTAAAGGGGGGGAGAGAAGAVGAAAGRGRKVNGRTLAQATAQAAEEFKQAKAGIFKHDREGLSAVMLKHADNLQAIARDFESEITLSKADTFRRQSAMVGREYVARQSRSLGESTAAIRAAQVKAAQKAEAAIEKGTMKAATMGPLFTGAQLYGTGEMFGPYLPRGFEVGPAGLRPTEGHATAMARAQRKAALARAGKKDFAGQAAAWSQYGTALGKIGSTYGNDLLHLGSEEALAKAAGFQAQAFQPPKLPAQKDPPKGKFHSFTPAGWATNATKATGWMLAAMPSVMAFQAVTQAVDHTVRRYVALEEAQRRLTVVFRGTSGSARGLADDVMKVAAATGRTTEEAMGAAVEWARGGGSQRDTAFLTRQSLIAANVAEMSVEDATANLATIKQANQLSPAEVAGVLGQINRTSNQMSRVLPVEIMEGLAKMGAIGRERGFSLPLSIATIGSTIEQTGQPGGEVGTAIKTMFSRLARGDVRSKLEKRFGILTELEGGGRVGGDALIEMIAAKLATEPDSRRDELLGVVAGGHQINKITGFFQAYNRGKSQVSDNLANLNSAEKENEIISQSLAKRWGGFKSEFDRAVFNGAGPVAETVKEQVSLASNILGLYNDLTSAGTKKGSLADITRRMTAPGGTSLIANADLINMGISRFRGWLNPPEPPSGPLLGPPVPARFRAADDPFAVEMRKRQADMYGDSLGGVMGWGGHFSSLESMLSVGAFNARMADAYSQDPRVLGWNETAALNTHPEMMRLSYLSDARDMAFRATGIEAAGYGVGTTPGEQMLNQYQGVTRELEKIESLSRRVELSDNERVRLLGLTIDQAQTYEKIQERLLSIPGERRQALAEGRQSFDRSLMMSGPGELLRRLAVKQIASSGMDPAKFMSLSPEARADYLQLSGGWKMGELDDEEAMLGKMRDPSLAARQAGKGARALRIAELRSSLLAGVKPPDLSEPAPETLVASVTKELGKMEPKVSATTTALEKLIMKIDIAALSLGFMAMKAANGMPPSQMMGVGLGGR